MYLYNLSSVEILYKNRADSRFAPSQWETPLQSNAIFRWLGASLESALKNSQQHKKWYDNIKSFTM